MSAQPQPMKCLETRSLRSRDYLLRPVTLDDVDERYRGWLLDKEVVRFLHVGMTDRSLASLRAYVEGVLADPDRYFYIIEDPETAQSIGTITLTLYALHRSATYGFLLGERRFWGGDAALQCQVALFDFAFEVLGLRKILASVYLGNVPSLFNLKRLGFIKEGVLRQEFLMAPDGRESSDAVRYGILVAEWRQASGKFDHLRASDRD